MKKAQGWEPIKHFAHKPKVRRNAARIQSLQVDQALQLSPWGHVAMVKTTAVDVSRANWKGILFLQQECGVYDERPRLVKRGQQ